MNSSPNKTRRILTMAALTTPWLAACSGLSSTAGSTSRSLRVGALFAGQRDDRGFMEAGWRGLEKARAELGVQTQFIDGILPNKEELARALTKLADSGVDLVVAHGGQNNEACAEVAAKYPRTRFVVTQGAVSAANLSSYDVLQEDSAYLAGVLAARVTRTGVVGHMSGIRVRPGLKGRAAFVAGVRATNPSVRVLTNFSGNQDDNALSRRVADAQIAAGADIIFTMLNAGRDGVTQACRAKGARQIGNVIDWTAVDSQVFIASAMADVGIGVYQAVKDMHVGGKPAAGIQKVGVANPQAVRLSMAKDVPSVVQQEVLRTAEGIANGSIKVPESYDGQEFSVPA